jgi:DNA-binding transcriptional LysR family regulator
MHGQLLFWIPREANPAFYDSVTAYVESTGAEPVYQQVRSATHAIEIVSHGFGLALLPSAAARLSCSGVVFRPVTDRFLQIKTAMFLRRERLRGSLQDLALFLISRLQGPKPVIQ